MPDLSLPLQLHQDLELLYSSAQVNQVEQHLSELAYSRRQAPPPVTHWTEQDCVLISYGHSLFAAETGQPPAEPSPTALACLQTFLEQRVGNAISTVHLLPFYPYSSDDGFSVINYRHVNEQCGDWTDIKALGSRYKLMFDLVLNHCSRHSDWFNEYLHDQLPGRDYFIDVDQNDMHALKNVVRPRSGPPFAIIDTDVGGRCVWATFSADQIDLNFKNPKVLIEFIDILLFYADMGARIIRLDAVAFAWKKLHSNCVHLPQTHALVRILRNVLEQYAAETCIITETNVPHAENISYFGAGDEAHMVYNFSLPPLLLHALRSGNGVYLTQWATQLAPPPTGCTFFNFTASHDGIGVRPLEGLLPDEELEQLLNDVHDLGGNVSMRQGPNGRDKPYELNITYYDSMGKVNQPDWHLQPARFLCSQAIALAFRGLPAVYLHSLIATRNDHVGVEQSGRLRSINRRNWSMTELADQLDDHNSHHHQVFQHYLRLLNVRREQAAFHPDAPMQVLGWGNQWFVFERQALGKNQQNVLVLANLTDASLPTSPSLKHWLAHTQANHLQHDLLGQAVSDTVAPYQVYWLAKH